MPVRPTNRFRSDLYLLPRSRLFAQDLLDLNLQVQDVPEDLSDLQGLFSFGTSRDMLEPQPAEPLSSADSEC